MRRARVGRRGRVPAAVMTVAILATACGGPKPASPSPSAGPTFSPSPTATPGPVTVRWFVGLGSGSMGGPIDDQKALVARFNKSQSDIVLKLEIVPNGNADVVLKTEIAAGNAPDIIGPISTKGRNGFEGQFLDLTDQVEKQHYDLTQFPPALVDYFRQGNDGLVGLPYVMYPGYIWYKKDFFTKAGLPNLPTRVGELYRGNTWDWANLA